MNSNFGLAAGNFMQAFLAARMAKEDRADREKERKLQTQLFELQLKKLQEEQSRQNQAAQEANSQARLARINRGMILGEGELGVATGQYPDLTSALADQGLQQEMRRYGFDPEKDFGVQREPAGIAELRALADPRNQDLLAVELARRKSGATNIGFDSAGMKFGTPPPGTAIMNTPNGPVLMNLPNSPAEAEARGRVAQLDLSYQNGIDQLERMRTKATELKNNPNLWLGVGLAGATAAEIPGSPGANVRADITSLVSQVGFGVLQAMRDASKTGGALGSTSEREIDLLQNAITALSTAQGAEQFRKRLKDLIDYIDAAQGRLRRAYETQKGSNQPSGLGATPPALGPRKVEPGTVVNFEDL